MENQADPFKDYNAERDPMASCENENTAGTSSRGQSGMYGDRQFAHQHLRFQFQIIVIGCYVRFVLYDHSGAIATHSFDYFQHSYYVYYLLDALAKMTPEQCGRDDSTEEITSKDEDAKRFVAAIKEAKKLPMVSPGVLVALDDDYPIFYRVKVPDASQEEKHRIMVIKAPFYVGRAINGRGTRSYIAYDTVDRRLVMLKDTWAVTHPEFTPETEVIEKLHHLGVSSLPDVICGGDVVSEDGKKQVTQIQDWAKVAAVWRAPCAPPILMRTYIHRRIAEDIYFSMECVNDSKDMLLCFRDIIIGKSIINHAFTCRGY